MDSASIYLTNFTAFLAGYDFLKTVCLARAYQPWQQIHLLSKDDLPLASISAQEDLLELLGQLGGQVRTRLIKGLGYCSTDADACISAISELVQNTYAHAAGELPKAYAAVRLEPEGMYFMVLSLGPDIASNLKEKYAVADDVAALRLACEPGVSSRRVGGLGLHHVLKTVRRLGATLCAHSGSARLVLTPRTTEYKKDIGDFLRGVQIGFFLPKRKESDAYHIF